MSKMITEEDIQILKSPDRRTPKGKFLYEQGLFMTAITIQH